MLTPKQAHQALQRRGVRALDDPTEIASPVRWWYDYEGVLCHAWWRGPTIKHKEYISLKVGE